MVSPSLLDVARKPMADEGKTPNFHPGGEKGKLHREMGIPEGEKIPEEKLRAATHSSDPEKRRDAIRAETMKKWKHTGAKKRPAPGHPGHRSGTEVRRALYGKE